MGQDHGSREFVRETVTASQHGPFVGCHRRKAEIFSERQIIARSPESPEDTDDGGPAAPTPPPRGNYLDRLAALNGVKRSTVVSSSGRP
jgi:hypothetical protein